jgi:5-methylcytosine-specific restriction protein A
MMAIRADHRNEIMPRITGRALNRELGLGAEHSLYHKDGYWYDELQQFPGVLFDRSGYVVFPTKAAYENSPHLHHPQNPRADGRRGTLSVPSRIYAIPEYVPDDRVAALHRE